MQSNKYNTMLRLFDSVDSADTAILERAEGEMPSVRLQTREFLLQVNAGEELQKGGLSIGQVRQLAEERPTWLREVSGLMTVVPLQATIGMRVRMYESVRELLTELVRDVGLLRLQILSMGTSDDFELALEHGATMIRVGTAIFGPRSLSEV